MNSFLAVALALVPLLVTAQHIVRLETKTGDVEDAGMLLGSIDIQINAGALQACDIKELDVESVGGFGQGDIDVFTGPDLQECGNFTVPGGNVSKLVLSHK